MTSEQIKESVKMREVVEMYGLRIDRKGFICCPFHREKTASLKLYDKSFHCFGCGASGDVFRFVQLMDNCDFKEAFIKLGGEYEHSDRTRHLIEVHKQTQKVVKDIQLDNLALIEMVHDTWTEINRIDRTFTSEEEVFTDEVAELYQIRNILIDFIDTYDHKDIESEMITENEKSRILAKCNTAISILFNIKRHRESNKKGLCGVKDI